MARIDDNDMAIDGKGIHADKMHDKRGADEGCIDGTKDGCSGMAIKHVPVRVAWRLKARTVGQVQCVAIGDADKMDGD